MRARFMRGPISAALATSLIAAVLLVSACGEDDAETAAGGGAAAPAAKGPGISPGQPISPVAKRFSNAISASETGEDVYQGTLSISVDYYGYDCQLRDLDLHPLGNRVYEMPVQVVRGPAAEAEGIRESSPYNLVVSANPGNEAGITTVSATVATDFNGNPVLFEYWKMDVEGSNVQGELVNSWRQAGLAANVFPTDRLVVPCQPEQGIIPKSIQTIEEGARIEGSISDQRAELTITGQTFDHERRFTARVTAER
jgi:hypothetical protein